MDIRASARRRPLERRVRPPSARVSGRPVASPLTQDVIVAAAVSGPQTAARDAQVARPSHWGTPIPRVNARILNAGSSAMPRPAEKSALSPTRSSSQHPPSPTDNGALVAALIRGDAAAWTELVDRFGPDVERLVAGAMGVDSDLGDIVQDVFVRVMERIHQLRDPAALKSWIASVAVFAARGHIRRRRRWRWIRFLAPADIPDVPATIASPENHALVHSTYKLLDTLPDDERMAFSLRFVAEMELTEVAAACGCSLATIKRRLSRAEINFLEGARKDPALNERIERGERWRSR